MAGSVPNAGGWVANGPVGPVQQQDHSQQQHQQQQTAVPSDPRQQQQQSQQAQQNPGGENNLEHFTDLWSTTPAKPDDGGNKQTIEVVQKPAEPQQTAQERWAAHVADLDFGVEDVMPAIQQFNTDGDPKALNAALQTMGQSIYKQALMTVNNVMSQRIDNAVKDAVKQAGANFQTSTAIQRLNSALPFTANKAIAPVANEVYSRFLKRGDDVDSAIKNVQRYFQETAKISAEDLHIRVSSSEGPNGGRGFEQEPDEEDWAQTLSGLNI